MTSGDRVKFVGPAYKHSYSPWVGKLGTVVRYGGHVQVAGDFSDDLIRVRFDGDSTDSVVGSRRIESILEGVK